MSNSPIVTVRCQDLEGSCAHISFREESGVEHCVYIQVSPSSCSIPCAEYKIPIEDWKIVVEAIRNKAEPTQ
jgi:hypothetical protein